MLQRSCALGSWRISLVLGFIPLRNLSVSCCNIAGPGVLNDRRGNVRLCNSFVLQYMYMAAYYYVHFTHILGSFSGQPRHRMIRRLKTIRLSVIFVREICHALGAAQHYFHNSPHNHALTPVSCHNAHGSVSRHVTQPPLSAHSIRLCNTPTPQRR